MQEQPEKKRFEFFNQEPEKNLKTIEAMAKEFEAILGKCDSQKATEDLFSDYLGKKGILNQAFQTVTQFHAETKALLGAKLNFEKQRLTDLLKSKQQSLQQELLDQELKKDWFDITLDGPFSKKGAIHPVTHIQYLLVDIFQGLGFEIMDGSEIETDYYNFEALNFPKHHPARDAQDTFYLENNLLLRTQTSNIQIRAMEKYPPPFQIAGPGKVFRAERIDAGHSSVFHQFEGMMVGKNISIAHMIFCLHSAMNGIFQRKVETRIRPGYFPFVEPGLELDIRCLICQGKGCNACKQVGWLELLGCGLTHPRVLELGGIDPEIYSGFAFGMGMDRMAMLKFGIHDIRLLATGNLNFAKQFIGLAG